ncbi:MAG TPA: hypothetical protein VK465_05640, partial [Fibrobacteria bacterium]|nr:hypothetical protein [Fibrobacteria bacterium]
MALTLATALSTSAMTLEGLPGTPFTPSAVPLGYLGFSAGIGATGHTDETLIAHRRFLHNLLPITGASDTADIQDLLSATLRVNAVLGVASWLDLGVSAPWHLDLIDDTEAKKLSGNGPGDVLFSAKAGGASTGARLLDAALLLSLSVPAKSPEGFLPKHTGYATGDSTSPAAAPRFHSTYAPGYAGRALLGLDLTRLETPLPFRAHLDAGLYHPGLGGFHAVLGGALEWTPLPFFGFFADLRAETRLSRLSQDLGRELATAAGGLHANSDDGIFF